MRRRAINNGQSMLEMLLLTAVVAAVVITALLQSSGSGNFLERARTAAEVYYNQALRGLVAGNYDTTKRSDPLPVAGGWCSCGACFNGYQERECACPRPAFGGANCSGDQMLVCGSTQCSAMTCFCGQVLVGSQCACPPGTVESGCACVVPPPPPPPSCVGTCYGKNCGDDGCGHVCGPLNGACQSGYACSNNICVESSNCDGRECGPNGDGFNCGVCPSPYQCINGHCDTSCTPDCSGLSCGLDRNCAQSCGSCPSGQSCVKGACTLPCTRYCPPNGVDSECHCGTDNCGNSWGGCAGSTPTCCITGSIGGVSCTVNQCVANTCCPATRECGSNLCGDGQCGSPCNELKQVCFGKNSPATISYCVDLPQECIDGANSYKCDASGVCETRVLYSQSCDAAGVCTCITTGSEDVYRQCPTESVLGGWEIDPCPPGDGRSCDHCSVSACQDASCP